MTSPRAPRVKGRAAVLKKNQALEVLQSEYIDAALVHPNSYNPNRQSEYDFELLVSSMLEDGFTQPIVVQRDSLEIVDGEHRWTAAIVCAYLKREGKDDPPDPEAIREARDNRALVLDSFGGKLMIPVVLTDMSMEQQRIATLRHNRARGSEDLELTAQLMRDLRELGALEWAQDSLALSDLEVSRLLDDVPAPQLLAADEWGEAWEPAPHHLGGTSVEKAGDATPDTQNRLRQAAERIEQATSDEEREQYRRELQTFRVSVIYTGEDADLVRDVLSRDPEGPAAAIRALCRSAR